MLLSYPINYLTPLYLFLYFFWLVRENRAILFWLYLWQLKEYHIGRFLAHFSTGKGRRIFLSPLFLLKLALLFASFLLYLYFQSRVQSVGLFSLAAQVLIPNLSITLYAFSFVVLSAFAGEAAYSVYAFFRRTLLHPVITKKSGALIAITHLFVFAFALALFENILGELSFGEYALAAFVLLLADVLTPLFVSLVVLLFQPFAVLGRNRLIALARKRRESLDKLLVIGIVGSYGKSSTKEFLARILSEKFKVAKTKANQNSEVGVSLAILNDVRPETEIFVCEIGAYDEGRVRYVSDIAKPKIGILTGIDEQHMATFGSQKNIIDAKYEILEVLTEAGIAILNWESRLVRESYVEKREVVKAKKTALCGMVEKKDYWAENIKIEIDRLSFTVVARDGDSADFNLRLPGRHNIEPILLAVAAARELGMTLQDIANICQKFEPSIGGMKKKPGVNGITVIDSTYSSNPDGVIAHLDYLKLFPGKKAVVMPCLIELGKASKEVHRRIGEAIGRICNLAIITTSDNFKEINAGAVNAGMRADSILLLENPALIEEIIKKSLFGHDVLLLEGRSPKPIIAQLTKKASD